jgi:signal transduction histidine kinase
LTIETNVEETEETVVVIAMVSLLFFFILVIGFLAINRWLSTKIWSPFNNTLTKLKSFKLSQETNIDFEKSSTIEFEELNEVLNKLIDQNISIYKTQKEFTENASHELQTPLAIIKNKLDLLVQKEPLTDRQYNIVEEVNVALSRISRINKNLLLLAKIENNQFEAREEVNISELVANALEFVKELRVDKNIVIHTAMEENVTVIGNRVLTEIMINNLLFNAFTHNTLNGELSIELKKGLLLISNSGVQALDEGDLYARFKKNSHNNKGNGLGLAIIYEICKKQKSSIEYTFADHLHHFKISFKI